MIDQTGLGTGGERHATTPITDVVPQGLAEVCGEISSARAMLIGGVPACRYTLTDGTGELDLLFLGRVKVAGMRCGRRCRAKGTVAQRDDRLALWNPRYWLEPTGPESPDVLVVDADQDPLRPSSQSGPSLELLGTPAPR